MELVGQMLLRLTRVIFQAKERMCMRSDTYGAICDLRIFWIKLQVGQGSVIILARNGTHSWTIKVTTD
jgi:hypothetical protein